MTEAQMNQLCTPMFKKVRRAIKHEYRKRIPQTSPATSSKYLRRGLTSMSIKRIVGGVLISLPFIVLFVVSAEREGVISTLFWFALAIVISGVIVLGIHWAGSNNG